MKKLFRFHRGGLAESLDTTVEVKGLCDMARHIKANMTHVSNIHISHAKDKDDRLPPEWGGYSRYVLADMEGCEGQCVGMCNFYEE